MQAIFTNEMIYLSINLNHKIDYRYSSVISSHFLGNKQIMRISKLMAQPRKCRIKTIPMGHSAQFNNCPKEPDKPKPLVEPP